MGCGGVSAAIFEITRMFNLYTRLCAFIARTCLKVGVAGMVLLVFAVLYQVIGRYIFNDTPTWAESGAVLLAEEGRRTFLQKWQERKRETITHPFLEEKLPWGLVPYVQSLLLARYLRGDLEEYPPFLWK